MNHDSITRCGFVALIGAPNTGKSTLINRLVGTKVSIVSHKVQTTRSLIRGIAIAEKSQIILVDTPGIFEPRRRLDRAMVQAAWGGAHDADIIALLVDATRPGDAETAQLLQGLADINRPKIALINKIDATRRDVLLGLAETVDRSGTFDRIFMISALGGDGVEDVTSYLAGTLPKSPWLYGEDEVTDVPLRRLAAEITREKLFERLHQELPYQATIETDDWKEQRDGSVRIEQTIIVGRNSHKKIVIGKGGQAIKAISAAARKEIADIVEKRVHLFVFVKVREKWTDDPERYRQMGIDFPRE